MNNVNFPSVRYTHIYYSIYDGTMLIQQYKSPFFLKAIILGIPKQCQCLMKQENTTTQRGRQKTYILRLQVMVEKKYLRWNQASSHLEEPSLAPVKVMTPNKFNTLLPKTRFNLVFQVFHNSNNSNSNSQSKKSSNTSPEANKKMQNPLRHLPLSSLITSSRINKKAHPFFPEMLLVVASNSTSFEFKNQQNLSTKPPLSAIPSANIQGLNGILLQPEPTLENPKTRTLQLKPNEAEDVQEAKTCKSQDNTTTI